MKSIFLITTVLFLSGALIMTHGKAWADTTTNPSLQNTLPKDYPIATVAGGCFWCTESEYRSLKGVVYTRVGYTGGKEPNPTYKEISAHKTGHAEALEIYYDPKILTYERILDHFFRRAHDPTQKDRQGPDVGAQYRSAVFYHDAEQKKIAEELIAKINAERIYKNPIVTEVVAAGRFWEAEDYHQQYYEKYEAKTGIPHVNEMIRKAKEKLAD